LKIKEKGKRERGNDGTTGRWGEGEKMRKREEEMC